MFRKAILAASNATPLTSAAQRTSARSQHSASAKPELAGGFTFSTTCGGSPMRAIYLTLLELALALRHMHSLNLVHCDVSARLGGGGCGWGVV